MIPGDDNPREACGVFGVYGPGEDVARLTFYGLYALQHRGQESAGIAASNGSDSFSVRTGMGLVSQVFDEEDLAFLRGHIAIGHTRYSTAGRWRATRSRSSCGIARRANRLPSPTTAT